MREGETFALQPITGKAQQPQHGAGLVFVMGMAMLGVLVLHLVALWVWKALPCTRARPVPEFLLFPVPELALANLMVLPLAMAATLLVMQTESPRHQTLGVICVMVILAYLGLVAAVLVAVSAKKEVLGLKYVQLDRGQGGSSKGTTATAPQRTFLGCCSAHADDGNNIGMRPPAPDSSIKDSSRLVVWSAHISSDSRLPGLPAAPSAGSTVLRFAPPHANGFWERADAAVQRELRLAYQGAAASGCMGRRAGSKLRTHAAPAPSLCRAMGVQKSWPGVSHHGRYCSPCAGGKRALVSLVSNLWSTRVKSFTLSEAAEVSGTLLQAQGWHLLRWRSRIASPRIDSPCRRTMQRLGWQPAAPASSRSWWWRSRTDLGYCFSTTSESVGYRLLGP